MPQLVSIVINGQQREVPEGTMAACAVLAAGITHFRTSVRGEPRAPLCGTGTCFECRVTIDGVMHVKSCQIVCREGMEIRTDG
ncbi:MAG TPA: (2Fe-2S)-binding protein [Bryobacteraceae bacterium]|nr:(2Fe-2S)-binding protein [Bryobacteraceae bacterium]